MATIIDKRKQHYEKRRFTHITHYLHILLDDELEDMHYTIECESRKEMHQMCVWTDVQWEYWINEHLKGE